MREDWSAREYVEQQDRILNVIIIIAVFVSAIIIAVVITGLNRYNKPTEMTINVYTVDGELLKSYHGDMRLISSGSNYVHFSYGDTVYYYYSCPVEVIYKK